MNPGLILNAAEDNLRLVFPLLPPPECWGYRNAPLCLRGKHLANGATSPALGISNPHACVSVHHIVPGGQILWSWSYS